MGEPTENGGVELWSLIWRLFEGILLFAPEPWRLVYVNLAASNWLGESIIDLKDRPIDALFEACALDTVKMNLERSWMQNSNVETRFTFRHRPTTTVRLSRVAVDGMKLVAVMLPAAERRNDPLTGLPDRDFVLSWLESVRRRRTAEDWPIAVVFLDIDDFKVINDRFGHLVGDGILSEAARRLARCVRGLGWPARFGGDEFVILLRGRAAVDDIPTMLTKLRASFRVPILLPEGEVKLTISVGVVSAADDTQTAEELIAAADRALYAAKRKV